MPTADDYAVLDLTPADLELMIGESLLRGELGANPRDDEQKRAVARNWFRGELDRLATVVCSNAVVAAQIRRTRPEPLALQLSVS